jgi:hypothetical protein
MPLLAVNLRVRVFPAQRRARLNDAPGSTTLPTGKMQQLKRPISQQPEILFDSNFVDQ